MFRAFFVVVCLTLGIVGLALAQTVTPAPATSTFNFTPWLQLVIGVCTASSTVIIGLVATWARAHFKLAAGSMAASILDLLTTAGAQFVTGALAKAPTTVAPVDVKNAAVAEFLGTLSETTQAATAIKGVTSATIAQRIDGAVAIGLSIPTTTTGATS
jgi:hypothetical protein